MTLVTRGLGAPQALLVTAGLGAATVLIVIPLEQSTELLENLQSIRLIEHEFSTFVTDRDQFVFAVEIDSTAETALIEQINNLVEYKLNVSIIEIAISLEALTSEMVNKVVDENC